MGLVGNAPFSSIVGVYDTVAVLGTWDQNIGSCCRYSRHPAIGKYRTSTDHSTVPPEPEPTFKCETRTCFESGSVGG